MSINALSAGRPSPFTKFDAPPHASQLEVAYAPEDIVRVDVVRRTESHTVTKPDGTTETVTEPAALSPYGVSLGGGLFYDLNGNLSLVPLMCFHAPIASAMQAGFSVKPEGILNRTDVTRNGNEVKVDQPGPMNEVTFTQNGDTMEMDWVGPVNTTTIRRASDGVVIAPPMSLHGIVIHTHGNEWSVQTGPFTSTTIRYDANSVKMDPPGWMNSTEITRSGDTIHVDPPGMMNTTDIKVEADKITVDRPGVFNSTTVYRDGDGIVVDPSGVLNGVTLRPI